MSISLSPADVRILAGPGEQEDALLSRVIEDSVEPLYQITEMARIAANAEKAAALLDRNRMQMMRSYNIQMTADLSAIL